MFLFLGSSIIYMPKRSKVSNTRQNPNVGVGKKLTNSVLTNPPTRKNSRFSNVKKRAIQASLGLAGLGITFFGGKQLVESHNTRVAKRNVVIEQRHEALNYVRNPKLWTKISDIYKWSSTNPVDRAKIEHIEKLSQRLEISVKDVLLTLEGNPFSNKGDVEQRVWELRNRSSRSNNKAEKDRLERIEFILKITSSQPFAEELESNIRKARGSLQKIKRLE